MTRLRSERGDSDPILTIASILVMALISAAMIGAILLVVQLGGKYVTEQVRSATLATAQKAWSQDANNASIVAVHGTTTAIFYEISQQTLGVYIQRGDNAGTAQCRKSEWLLDNGVLTDTVTRFDKADCDLTAAATPVSTATPIRLDGLTAAARFEAFNAAGRDLHFTGTGAENGVTGSTSVKDAWWRDTEWAFAQPRTINLVTNMDLPISGDSPAKLLGSTWIRPPPPDGAAPADPEQTPRDPDGVAITNVDRSSWMGAVYRRFREGVEIRFAGGSCAPYSTEYTVEWTPDAASAALGAVVRTQTFTTFDAPGPVDFDRVPNGSKGKASVSAACPPSVSSRPSKAYYDYTQSLPAPVLRLAISDPPNVHNLSWPEVISSLPVQYRIDVSADGGPFAALSTTAGTAKTVTWPLGSTYGMQYAYRVVGVVGSVTSLASNEVIAATPWPAVATPALAGRSAGSVYTVTITPAAGFACPAGTRAEFRLRWNINGAGWQGWSTWSTTAGFQHSFSQGEKGEAEGLERCAYSGDRGNPVTSDPDSSALKPFWVQPITGKPAVPPVEFVPNNSADGLATPQPPVTVAYPTAGCPAVTTVQYRTRFEVDGNLYGGAELDPYGWGPWSAASASQVSMRYGYRLGALVQARCVRVWPGASPPAAYGPPVESAPPVFVRPIPAPLAPQIWNDSGGTSAPKEDRVLWTADACPAGTRVEYQLGSPFWSGTWMPAGTLSQNVNTAWGTKYDYRVAARCVSDYTTSPNSYSVFVTWTTNVPTPATPYIRAQGPVYGPANVLITAGGSTCPAGTSIEYLVGRTGGESWNATAHYSWAQVGTTQWSAYTRCLGPNRVGGWSPAANVYWTLYQHPAPRSSGGTLTANVQIYDGSSTRVSTYPDVLYADSYRWQVETWDNGVLTNYRYETFYNPSEQFYGVYTQGRFNACNAYGCTGWTPWAAARYVGG